MENEPSNDLDEDDSDGGGTVQENVAVSIGQRTIHGPAEVQEDDMDGFQGVYLRFTEEAIDMSENPDTDYGESNDEPLESTLQYTLEGQPPLYQDRSKEGGGDNSGRKNEAPYNEGVKNKTNKEQVSEGPEQNLESRLDSLMDSREDQREIIIDEVNRRVVAPLLLGTALALLFAAGGAIINGSWLLALVIIPGPCLVAWALWKMSKI